MALLQAAQADADVRAEEDLYAAILRASGGYNHNRDPSNRGINTTDVFDLNAGLSVLFSIGTVLDASISGRRTTGGSTGIIPVGGGVGSLGGGAFGPYHLVIGSLTLVQPLLRGAGNDIGLASLRQAKLRRKATESVADQSASALCLGLARLFDGSSSNRGELVSPGSSSARARARRLGALRSHARVPARPPA